MVPLSAEVAADVTDTVSALPVRPDRMRKGPLPYQFLTFLPGIYQGLEDEFLGHFLEELEHLWVPIEAHLEDVAALYDSSSTPAEALPWLAMWVGLVLDARWPEHKRRRLIRRAVDLYQMRGTRRGLEEFLEIYTGLKPQISEPFMGSPFGEETIIGDNAVIGDIPEHCFVVTVFAPEDVEIDEAVVRQILDAEKPAHTAYDLCIERRQMSSRHSNPRLSGQGPE